MRPLFILWMILASTGLKAQEELLEELDNDQDDVQYTFATFKSQRLVNGQTMETIPGGDLQFIFAHRFGPINGGLYEFFGLDQAFVRIGLEYGVTERLGAGIGRNSVDKTVDAYLRYKFASQKEGASNFPFTLTGFGGIALRLSPRNSDLDNPLSVNDRIAYTTQLLIARKFTSALSVQLMPTVVHKNSVAESNDVNTTALLGIGGRVKITKSVAITSEYYYRVNAHENTPYYNPLGFGIDIETGGHVFQLVFTNTRGLTERAYLTETGGEFFDGDIHFGFNVTRMFSFKRRTQE